MGAPREPCPESVYPAENLKRQTFLFSEFSSQRAKQALPLLRRSAIVQGHCHHKSVLEFEHEQTSLRAMQLDARVLDSGCCGMAGSFGFEAQKYGISMACGERALLPEVRRQSVETLVIADGFRLPHPNWSGNGARGVASS